MTPDRPAWPVALSIAGSDSCGGAGIQADLRTFGALGLRGATAVTALTAQEPSAVRGVVVVAPDFVVLQARTVLDALPVVAIKTGMLANAAIVRAVADLLRRLAAERGGDAPRVVVDPVMVAASGAPLLDADAVGALLGDLVPQADVVTPNLLEAARLIGADPAAAPAWSREEQAHAAREIVRLGARAALVKGGHREEGPAADVIVEAGGRETWLEAPRVAAASTHGTGCTLAAALAAGLGLGLDVPSAARAAKRHLTRALERGLDRPFPAGEQAWTSS